MTDAVHLHFLVNLALYASCRASGLQAAKPAAELWLQAGEGVKSVT